MNNPRALSLKRLIVISLTLAVSVSAQSSSSPDIGGKPSNNSLTSPIEIWNSEPWAPATRTAADRESIRDDAPKPGFVSSQRRLLTAPELSDASDEWISKSLSWVDYVLKSYSPSIDEYPVRRAALVRMDDILHIKSAPSKTPVQQFFGYRIETAIAEIEATHVSKGLRIWKLYNHGFFIRTPTVSFVFDIVPGGGDPAFRITPDQIRRIAAQADVAFISHSHADHANKEVAGAFLALGKPVIAPPGLWSDDPVLSGKLRYATRIPEKPEIVEAGVSHQKLTFIAYPGHQGAQVLNNIYLVTTPEHFSIVHTGDQTPPSSQQTDFELFDEIGKKHSVDVLIPNVWTVGLQKEVRAVHPRLVVSGHENEMAHVVPHREDYTQSYTRLYGSPSPYLIMTWGETFHYSPGGMVQGSAH
jgi:L-ascorbate metabolism protein UlaG (beta-lactamase superfamily)